MGDYDRAKKRANKLGFKVYRGKDFGGGFVTTSYNLENDVEASIDAREVKA
jgi:ABC-type transport system substrate-binding protein